MKKLLALTLVLVLLLGMSACVSQEAREDFVDVEAAGTTGETAAVPVETLPEILPTAPMENHSNYFRNENNNYYDNNAVSVRPRYVYWQDGKLIAECFVINGFGHAVHNIRVESLSFSNHTTNIASASFGTLENVTLAPYTHVIWTFEFSADCVSAYGADLSYLSCEYSVNNNY